MNIPKQYLVVGVAAVASFAAGATAGYFVARKRLESEYAEVSEREIAEAKTFYRALNKKDEFATPESTISELVKEAAEALQTYEGTGDESKEDLKALIRDRMTHNIFEEGEVQELDMKDEIASRLRAIDRPYVVDSEDFLSNENDWPQTTLTYYEGDDVLVDERDQVVEDPDMVVCLDNLQRFGHGSKDPNVVYIRNDVLEADYEILKSKGKYTEIVLGFIEHSDRRPKIRKFRGDDE